MDIVIKKSMKDLICRGFKSPSVFAREILELDLHEEQEECIEQMRLKDHFGLTTGNRWGKGDLVVIYSAWLAAYKPVAEKFQHKKLGILNTSISQDQANIVFDKFNDQLLDRPKFSWMIKDVKRSPFPNIKFKSGVEWWFRNASQDGKFLEGRSYFFINFDEADLQKDFKKFIEEIIMPRLWDFGGGLCWTTTPRRGKKNAYKIWDYLSKQNKLKNDKIGLYRGDSRKNKFLHTSAIERMNKLPKRLFNKNVIGLYEDSDGVISNEMCDFSELISDGAQDGPMPGGKYINVWDFARSHTFNVGLTIELCQPLQLRSWERMKDDKNNRNRAYWQLVTKRVKDRHLKWGGRTIIDATGIGDVLASYLKDIHPVEIKLHTNLRNQIIEIGLSVFENGEIGIPLETVNQVIQNEYWSLRDELTDFDPAALDYIIWDFVCCLFIGCWFARGYRSNSSKSKKKMPPRCIPMAKGVKKNAMAF